MITYLEFLNEEISPKKSNDDIIKWFNELNIQKGTRKPRKISKSTWEFLKSAKNQIHFAKKYKNNILGDYNLLQVLRVYNDLTLDDYNELNSKFMGAENSNELMIDGITFKKEDSSSKKRFVESAKQIAELLKNLKGYHKKIIKKLVVVFKSKSELKSKAKYKQDKDEIWIRITKDMPMDEKYASLKYIIVHELGHRYLQKQPQTWNYDGNEWITTKYSKVDSWNGEEKFAELFAISHWSKNYPEFKKQITAFKKIIK